MLSSSSRFSTESKNVKKPTPMAWALIVVFGWTLCLPSPSGQDADNSKSQQSRRSRFGDAGEQAIGGREGVERGCVTAARRNRRLRGALVEVGREQREVRAVGFVVVIEIAFIPAIHGLVEVRRQDREVGAIHFAIEVGVAEQGVHHFNLARSQAGGV